MTTNPASGTDVGLRSTRRDILAIAPAVLFSPSLASAMPSTDSPLRRLYRQWLLAYDAANDREIDETEFDSRMAVCDDLARLIDAKPMQSAEDLALKIKVAVGNWCCSLCPDNSPNLCAEIDLLSGASH